MGDRNNTSAIGTSGELDFHKGERGGGMGDDGVGLRVRSTCTWRSNKTRTTTTTSDRRSSIGTKTDSRDYKSRPQFPFSFFVFAGWPIATARFVLVCTQDLLY